MNKLHHSAPVRTLYSEKSAGRSSADGHAMSTLIQRYAVLAILASSITAAAPAQESQGSPAPADQPGQPRLTQLSLAQLGDTEVTTASKEPEKVWQTPAAVYVLTQEDIRRSGATSIPEVLRLVPGVQVSRIDNGRHTRICRPVLQIHAGAGRWPQPLYSALCRRVLGAPGRLARLQSEIRRQAIRRLSTSSPCGRVRRDRGWTGYGAAHRPKTRGQIRAEGEVEKGAIFSFSFAAAVPTPKTSAAFG
jgi:hypothetical protein